MPFSVGSRYGPVRNERENTQRTRSLSTFIPLTISGATRQGDNSPGVE
jgi:hypothetical protein